MTTKFTVKKSILGITLPAEVTIDEQGVARFNFDKTNGVPSVEDVIDFKIDKLPGFNLAATDNAREADKRRFRALLAEHRNKAHETADVITVSKLVAESGAMAGVISSLEIKIDESGVAHHADFSSHDILSARDIDEYEVDKLPGFNREATLKAREIEERKIDAQIAERRIKEAASGETSYIEIEGRSVKRKRVKHS